MDKPRFPVPKFTAEVEPHLRTKEETEELFPLLEVLASGLCQTQSFILNELARAGLTVVLLDPHAREVAPDPAPSSERREERGRLERDQLLKAILLGLAEVTLDSVESDAPPVLTIYESRGSIETPGKPGSFSDLAVTVDGDPRLTKKQLGALSATLKARHG